MFAEGNEVEWATPVLYLRSPDGRIFTRSRVSGADARAREDTGRKAREEAERRQAEEDAQHEEQTPAQSPDPRLQAHAARSESDLRDTQKDRSKDLDEIRFVLQALVTTTELSHLKNLSKGSTSSYRRNDSLQAELRRLRSIGLIKSKRYIGEMPTEFDLAEWVELTDRGVDYLRRLEETDTPFGKPDRAGQ